MALGARIKEARDAIPLDQAELCSKIDGLTQQSLSNLETRDSRTSEYALRIADALGVSIRWLLDGDGVRDEPEWPFPDIERARFYRLTPNERIEVQAVARERIEKFETALRGKRRSA